MAVGRREITLTVKPDSRGYCGLRKISAYCDWGTRTTRTKMKDEGFPYFRLPSGTLRFSYSEVDDWMRRHRGKDKAAQMADKLIEGL